MRNRQDYSKKRLTLTHSWLKISTSESLCTRCGLTRINRNHKLSYTKGKDVFEKTPDCIANDFVL